MDGPVARRRCRHFLASIAPALLRAKAANPDVLVLHLHAASTVLAVRQARQLLPGLPIVAGSAMHQPATAALLEPAELKGVCAETAASPVSATSQPMRDFLAAFDGQLRVQIKHDPELRTRLRRQLPNNIFVQFLAGPKRCATASSVSYCG